MVEVTIFIYYKFCDYQAFILLVSYGKSWPIKSMVAYLKKKCPQLKYFLNHTKVGLQDLTKKTTQCLVWISDEQLHTYTKYIIHFLSEIQI